jgi:hypothetical protein
MTRRRLFGLSLAPLFAPLLAWLPGRRETLQAWPRVDEYLRWDQRYLALQAKGVAGGWLGQRVIDRLATLNHEMTDAEAAELDRRMWPST